MAQGGGSRAPIVATAEASLVVAHRARASDLTSAFCCVCVALLTDARNGAFAVSDFQQAWLMARINARCNHWFHGLTAL